MSILRITKLFIKDCKIHLGRGSGLTAILVFPASTSFAVSFITRSGTGLIETDILIIWLIMFLCSLGICGRTLSSEFDSDNYYFLRMHFKAPEIFISKLAFNFIAVLVISASTLLVYLFFNALTVKMPLTSLFVFIAGICALSAVLSSLAVISAVSGGRNALFGILSIPLLIPVSAVFVKSLAQLQSDLIFSTRSPFLLLSFSVFICAVSYIVFEKIWESAYS